MIDPNINPHEAAVEELLEWEAQGIRHVFDPELVTLADIFPNRIYPNKYMKKEQKNEKNN